MLRAQGCSEQQFVRLEWENENNRHPQTQNKEATVAGPPHWAWTAVNKAGSSLVKNGALQTPCVTLLPTAHLQLPATSHTGTRLCACTVPCPSWAHSASSHEQLLCNHALGRSLIYFSAEMIEAGKTRHISYVMKNGNRTQEYKRRHTGCGSGSLAEEWVVD